MRPEGMSPVELYSRILEEYNMSRMHRPWGEIQWTEARIELRNPIPMESTPMENLLAGLPDASGTFTGYFDTGAFEDFYDRLLGPGLATIMVGPDACSPDTSQPYPF